MRLAEVDGGESSFGSYCVLADSVKFAGSCRVFPFMRQLFNAKSMSILTLGFLSLVRKLLLRRGERFPYLIRGLNKALSNDNGRKLGRGIEDQVRGRLEKRCSRANAWVSKGRIARSCQHDLGAG